MVRTGDVVAARTDAAAYAPCARIAQNAKHIAPTAALDKNLL
jgi:hypothetical protein